MTEPRTVTLLTLDAGEVTLPEPSWCAGHENHAPVHRVDLTHYGHEQHLNFDGETLWTVLLGQSPFATIPRYRALGLYIEQGGLAATLDPAALDQLAAALVEHAVILRTRARELSVLLGGGQ
ncbi:hypothetical protein AB0H69_07485 [Streptomyces phaeochromogenes]|uniref:DUF6907 domain-containing protein n=1 Tax=Streptomyces phaeochromogenes TaxID=1923 RepID=UPI0033E9CC79